MATFSKFCTTGLKLSWCFDWGECSSGSNSIISSCDGCSKLLKVSTTILASSCAQKYMSIVCRRYLVEPVSRGSWLANRHSSGSLVAREVGEELADVMASTTKVTKVGNR
jgi:hypothetical protein